MTDGETARSRVREPRHDGIDEWEVFLRTNPSEPLVHAGSVTAPTAEAAHEHAGALFDTVESIWLCPTDEVVRFTARTLGATAADDRDEDTTDTDRPTEAAP